MGVIGCGYWGPNLIRNINSSSKANLKWVCDLDEVKLSKIGSLYPNVKKTNNIDDLLNDPQIDAVAIATPVNTHYPIAKKCLNKYKNVLIEKPISSTSIQAEELISIAEKNNLSLMCDHTYCYSSAIRKIKDIIDDDVIGKVLYYDSTRINLGLFQKDINVAWDLAPHDLSILFYLFDQKPLTLNATGAIHSVEGIENISYISLFYPNNFIAHINVNWLSPLKQRKVIITGDKKMLLWDDLNQSESIKIYDTGIGIEHFPEKDKRKFLISYRHGDTNIPQLDSSEPLGEVINEFVNSINENRKSLTDGISGFNVLKVLEAVNASIKNNGNEVKLSF